MATINFYYRGKSETGNLTIRLKHSTSIDYRVSSDIVSNRKYWFKTNNKHRRLDELSYLDAEAKKQKAYLENFQEQILLRFNNDFNTGIPISKEWFVRNIDEVTNILSTRDEIDDAQTQINKAQQEQLQVERDVYNKNLVTTAINRVIDVEYFNNNTQQKIYRQVLNKIQEYQKSKKVILQIKDVTQDFINLFSAFLTEELMHQISTSKKHCKSIIHAVKYQKKAFPDTVLLFESINDIKYPKLSKADKRRRKDEIVITLSFEELDKIHNTKVPKRLLNAKKVILFGSEVGLRVSDFNKLSEKNLKKEKGFEYWEFWNKKTATDVVIPKNDRIKRYINFYGEPYTKYTKTSEVIINREIKEVCEIAEINQVVKARKSQSVIINETQTRRVISSEYYKFEVIACHTLRRTFCTNYYGILELADIRQITGHTSDEQLLEYINESKDVTERTTRMLEKMNGNAKFLDEKNRLKVIKKVST